MSDKDQEWGERDYWLENWSMLKKELMSDTIFNQNNKSAHQWVERVFIFKTSIVEISFSKFQQSMPHHKHLAETANIINLTTLSSCTNGVTFSDAVQPHSQYVATMTGNIPSVFFFLQTAAWFSCYKTDWLSIRWYNDS